MYESAASGAAATTPTAGGYTVAPVATITAKGARNVALRDSAVAAVAAAATGSGGTAVTTGTAGGLARACRRGGTVAAGATGRRAGSAMAARAAVAAGLITDAGHICRAVPGAGRGAGRGIDPVCPGEAGAAGTTGAAMAEQPGVAAVTARTPDACGHAGAADTAVAAVAPQPPPVPTGTAGRAGTTGPAVAAVADQPGRASAAAGLTEPASRAVATVAKQQPAGRARLPGCRPVGAVSDQRAPQKRLGGRIHRTQQTPLNSGLSAGIPTRGRSQRLHKLLVKRCHLYAERLILPSMGPEQPRNRRRHFIGSRSHHFRRRHRRGRISRAHLRTNTR